MGIRNYLFLCVKSCYIYNYLFLYLRTLYIRLSIPVSENIELSILVYENMLYTAIYSCV